MFFNEEWDIPDEVDRDSPISTPIASRVENMSENVLLQNKGHLKLADRIEFASTENVCASVRNIPQIGLSQKSFKLKKGSSQDEFSSLKRLKRKSRAGRRSSRRPKSHIKKNRSNPTSARRISVQKRDPKIEGESTAKGTESSPLTGGSTVLPSLLFTKRRWRPRLPDIWSKRLLAISYECQARKTSQ